MAGRAALAPLAGGRDARFFGLAQPGLYSVLAAAFGFSDPPPAGGRAGRPGRAPDRAASRDGAPRRTDRAAGSEAFPESAFTESALPEAARRTGATAAVERAPEGRDSAAM